MLDQLFRVPSLVALQEPEARLVRGLRLWTVLRRAGQCPLQAVADQLGSKRAAAHLHLMLAKVAAAWPDPFAVAPLCCARLSHDEKLFADMIRLGAERNRAGFDRLLGEMIGEDAREPLYLSAVVLGGALPDR
jgi:hypothetical protein